MVQILLNNCAVIKGPARVPSISEAQPKSCWLPEGLLNLLQTGVSSYDSNGWHVAGIRFNTGRAKQDDVDQSFRLGSETGTCQCSCISRKDDIVTIEPCNHPELLSTSEWHIRKIQDSKNWEATDTLHPCQRVGDAP